MDDSPTSDLPTDEDSRPTVETDERFPSGRWLGFYLQRGVSGRQRMELHLQFSHGVLSGEGRDTIGEFLIRGSYDIEDGRCHWHKRYLARHDVFYQGYNEGKGVWGLWEIATQWFSDQGGFHIWPEGMPDPTVQRDEASEDVPVSFDQEEDWLSDERLNEETLEPVSTHASAPGFRVEAVSFLGTV